MPNENAIPYRGDTYERIFVHSFQALNFLGERNPEAAGVEVRRANLAQRLLRRYFSCRLAQIRWLTRGRLT